MKDTLDTLKILVLLDLRHAAAREMTGGIMRFAAAHRDVEVQVATTEPVGYFRSWKPHALITDAISQDLSDDLFAALAGKAVVYANARPRAGFRHAHAVISTDERLLAVTAAKLHLSHHLAHFGYVGTPSGERWSEARGKIFLAAMKEQGFSTRVFSAPAENDCLRQESALTEWLRSLPKPSGIWAASDQRAKQVLDACRRAGIAVPDQVQVLGVDDDSAVCEMTLPSLSSIAPDFEAGGFEAAAFLYRALAERKVRGRHVLKFGLKGVVERLSTADTNGTVHRIAAAREYIRKHATAGVGVSDVAASLGISVRLLEKSYRLATGHTVLEDLQSVKLAKAKELLRRTTMPIDNIGPFCGFRSPAHLKTLFHRTYGMTMSDYRRS